MTDWRDSTFHRQQLQRLAHRQPLEPLHPDPWMTPRQWIVCAAAIVGLVVWVFA